MSDIIIYIDSSEILEGKFEELKQAVSNLVDFVNLNESSPLAYSFYFNDNHTRMTLVQIHPDAASLENHMQVAGSSFPRFKDLIRFLRIDIFGKTSDKLTEQLYRKVKMLGSGTIVFHELYAGFTRFGIKT